MIVGFGAHQGTDLCDAALCVVFLVLKEDLQAASSAYWNFSITVSMHGAAATLWLRCSSSPSTPLLSLFIPLRSCSMICIRLP